MNSLPSIACKLGEAARRNKAYAKARDFADAQVRAAVHAGLIERRFVADSAMDRDEALANEPTPALVHEIDSALAAIQICLAGSPGAADSYDSISKLRKLVEEAAGNDGN